MSEGFLRAPRGAVVHAAMTEGGLAFEGDLLGFDQVRQNGLCVKQALKRFVPQRRVAILRRHMSGHLVFGHGHVEGEFPQGCEAKRRWARLQ